MDGEPGAQERVPAHRPSRKGEIVDAATRVFARQGYVDTSIQDVARDAGMAPAAIYYHFAGKEELYEAALVSALTSVSAAAEEARPTGLAADATALERALQAVWRWSEDHPAESALINGQLSGATHRVGQVRREFQRRQVDRAFDYLVRQGEADRSVDAALAVSTFVRLAMDIHPMRAEGGPLARSSSRALLEAQRVVSARILGLEG